MSGINRCYFCICEVCNRRRCPMYRCRKGLLERCMYCMQNFKVPTTKCDYFEMKYRRHVYYIVRKGLTSIERIERKLDVVLKNSNGGF